MGMRGPTEGAIATGRICENCACKVQVKLIPDSKADYTRTNMRMKSTLHEHKWTEHTQKIILVKQFCQLTKQVGIIMQWHCRSAQIWKLVILMPYSSWVYFPAHIKLVNLPTQNAIYISMNYQKPNMLNQKHSSVTIAKCNYFPKYPKYIQTCI